MARKKKAVPELEVNTPEVPIEQVEPVTVDESVPELVTEPVQVIEEQVSEAPVEELTAEEPTTPAVPELDEDDDALAIQALEDEKLEVADDYGVFKQQEGMIAWSIENLYREDGSMRSKKELKLNPPTLKVEGSGGQSVDFILTKNFTKTLKDGLDDVYRGMFGVHKAKAPMSSFKEALYNSVMENPLRIVVVGLIVLVCAALAIFS